MPYRIPATVGGSCRPARLRAVESSRRLEWSRAEDVSNVESLFEPPQPPRATDSNASDVPIKLGKFILDLRYCEG